MYRLRSDLMLDNDYQRLIFALGQLREKNKAVLGLVAVLGIMHFEVDMEFSNYEVNVINKDINAYLSWKLKRMLKTLKR
ncbi:hypothetical protein FHS18_004039 [Paenibacillus phyllosphaerae]|uniref:Uncharacterized protein n=1 Tax=Paenibacillus phyllosphaerae TaxID=274593 RepID=A0A7W5FP40_9BACL|nr:hypothetical protein [Paenibacillus phyllosphaerae]MBB3111971.1 hypothetical protein [Paenibacillus phyllosphaerae]